MSDMLYGWYVTDTYGGLSDSEKEYNASKAMTFLRKQGFTKYAAAGFVGNMWTESQMNPAQWQSDTPFSGGYGLVQWTPYTKYSDWAGPDWQANGPLEMQRIQYERENGIQFTPSPEYPMWNWNTYAAMAPEEGMTVDETINLAAEVWVYNYGKPTDPASAHLPTRKYHARYVYYNCPGSIMPPWLLMWWANKNRRLIR